MRVTHRQYMLFHHGLATARAPMWTTRPVRQLFIARFPALDPFVANIRADPEPAAKFAPVRPCLHRQSNKLTPLAHDRHLLPRHGWPPFQPNPCNDEVSAMSPNTRQSCPRDEHLTRGSIYCVRSFLRRTWIAGSSPAMTVASANCGSIRPGTALVAALHFFKLSGTVPPVAASLVITCSCNQMFISAEPLSAPV
jgi:hypothetical protein